MSRDVFTFIVFGAMVGNLIENHTDDFETALHRMMEQEAAGYVSRIWRNDLHQFVAPTVIGYAMQFYGQ